MNKDSIMMKTIYSMKSTEILYFSAISLNDDDFLLFSYGEMIFLTIMSASSIIIDIPAKYNPKKSIWKTR